MEPRGTAPLSPLERSSRNPVWGVGVGIQVFKLNHAQSVSDFIFLPSLLSIRQTQPLALLEIQRFTVVPLRRASDLS